MPPIDPIETDEEAAAGHDAELVARIRLVVQELESRAEAAQYISRTTMEGEQDELHHYGRMDGLTEAAGLLRRALMSPS